MIKKIFTAIVCSSLVFGTLGCGFTEGVKQGYEEATENNSTDNKSEDTQEKDNNKDSSQKETILKQGEEATIKTDYGSYKVKVVSVNFMPKTDYRNSVIQFVYEYDNIDFKTGNNINGLLLQPTDFKLTDENGYVLSTMYRGWKDEMQEAKILMPGEKCIAKMTYKINSEDIKKVKITMDRLNQMSTYYEIDVTR